MTTIEIVGSWEVRALEKTDAAFSGRESSTARSLHVNHTSALPFQKWRHSIKGVAEKVAGELTKFPLENNWSVTVARDACDF